VRIFRESDWVLDTGESVAATITVKKPEVEHRVRIRDFETVEGKATGRATLKSDLRCLIEAWVHKKIGP